MSITYLEAIREAQLKALTDDPRVFIYGEDVGGFGGAFKATKNLQELFPGRVMDAPISEDAITGFAVGSAIEAVGKLRHFVVAFDLDAGRKITRTERLDARLQSLQA